MQWIASAAFGFEGFVKRDLQRLDVREIAPLDFGGVAFEGDWADGFRANLWLRTADRVLLKMGAFPATDFEMLFQGISAIAWEDVLPADAAFPVRAQCARSTLMSPSACQSIVKKAVVERLRGVYHTQTLPETGATYQIDVALRNDTALVTLDTSGLALNKRGYRTWNGVAPLRETLAAAMVLGAPWRMKDSLYDPCCGTGTILIEAAYIALDRAPGLTRAFDMEQWACVPKPVLTRLREDACARWEAGKQRPIDIAGSDIDPEAIELAARHVRQAGLEGRIRLETKDLRNVTRNGAGVFMTNPPYGERMGDRQAARAVAKQLGELFTRSGDWTMVVITSDTDFERAFGRRAAKRRRLYNGRLECEIETFVRGGNRS